jgi:hypothetical protein
MQELAELSAEARDIALSRFRLLEPHLEQHRSSRQMREFPFGRRSFFWLLRQIASKHLRHNSALTYTPAGPQVFARAALRDDKDPLKVVRET